MTETSWTASCAPGSRRWFRPVRLLPDRQPAYVASWIYVFGVLTLAALRRRAGHRAWCWRSAGPPGGTPPRSATSSTALHLWSVELFFVFMVIHLWGKFFMAAWRGRRALTWITGAVAFLGSIGTAFTGYLSQTNFDSQWISDPGQGRPERGRHRRRSSTCSTPARCCCGTSCCCRWSSASWSVWHVLLVRRHGVVPPIDADAQPPATAPSTQATSRPRTPSRRPRRRERAPSPPRPRHDPGRAPVPDPAVRPGQGVRLAAGRRARADRRAGRRLLLARTRRRSPSPTGRRRARTTSSRPRPRELAGTSTSARLRAAVQHTRPTGRSIGPLPLQKWAGVTHPGRHAPTTSCSRPLRRVTGDPALTAALRHAGPRRDRRPAGRPGRPPTPTRSPTRPTATRPQVAAGDYGPVPVLARPLPRPRPQRRPRGRCSPGGRFYRTDATRALLLLADGAYLEDQARAQHLGGDQWGMMNETGNYPGQPWMWLYTFWYQVKPFSTSDNADALVWGLMVVLTLGLRPRAVHPRAALAAALLGVHRLIWRDYHRTHRT